MTNRIDTGLGPCLLVIVSVPRMLIEHVSATDPTIQNRITAKVETYLANLVTEVEGYGEFERVFTERARICLVSLMPPPKC